MKTVTASDFQRETAVNRARHHDGSGVESTIRPGNAPDSDGGANVDARMCPMCGAVVSDTTTRCQSCGELLRSRGPWAPRPIDASEVIARSWKLYRSNFMLLICATLICYGLPPLLSFSTLVATMLIITELSNTGNALRGIVAFENGIVFLALFGLALYAYYSMQQVLQAGMTVFLLRVARSETPRLGDLFSGIKYASRFFRAGFHSSMPWPLTYIMVDRDEAGPEARRLASAVRTANGRALLTLRLRLLSVNVLGFLACGVGLVASVPLGLLWFAVAYYALTCGLDECEQQ